MTGVVLSSLRNPESANNPQARSPTNYNHNQISSDSKSSSHAAVQTQSFRHIIPTRARRNTVIRPPLRFIINQTTDNTLKFSHGFPFNDLSFE